MLSTSLAIAVVFFAVTAPETVELTPETMAEHKFHIATRMHEPNRTTHMPVMPDELVKLPLVEVYFNPHRGPASAELRGATLVLEENGEAKWAVPMQLHIFLGNDGGKMASFRMSREDLANAKLYIQRKDWATFVLSPQDFLSVRME